MLAPRLLAVGVDGASGGWVAAAAFGTDGEGSPPVVIRTEVGLFAAVSGHGALELLSDWRTAQPGGSSAPVAVDVPIGLPKLGGSRPCDFECRRQLPGKGSSVFPPPARFLVERFDTADVSNQQLWAAITERQAAELAAGRDPNAVAGMSAQSCGFFNKVFETDRFVRRHRRADGTWPIEEWLFEVHPELCFQRMHDVHASTGTPPTTSAPQGLAGKKTARGHLQRLAMVRNHFPDAEQRIRDLDWSAAGNLDDPLDAYAALWTALRVRALGFDGVEVLGRVVCDGGEPVVPRDNAGTGLLMRILA